MANVIIVLILVVVVGIALKSTRKHMKGESSCCGGGGEIYQALEDKKLDNPIIFIVKEQKTMDFHLSKEHLLVRKMYQGI